MKGRSRVVRVGGRTLAGITRRRFLGYLGAGSLLAVGGGFLGGCGGSAGGGANVEPDSISLDGPIDVEFWHIQATLYGEAIKEIIGRFNETNEYGITVNEVFQGDYGELNQKIRAALQGGGLPDVSMAYEADTLEYMNARQVLPLDAFINSESYGLSQQEIDDIAPGVLARQRVPAYEGKTMSWPHGNSSQGMYYNLDILEQAGIEEPATDWEEFLEQARRIKEQTGLPTLPVGAEISGLLDNIIRSRGIDPISEDGMTSNYGAPEVVDSLTLLKTMFDEELAYTAQDTEQEFTNQRSAMEISTTARTSSKIELIGDSFPWGITLTPQGDAPEPITALFGGNHVLFDNGDEQRLLAGWLFMRYFANTEAQALYAARTGYFPATLPARATELLRENYEQFPQKEQAFDEVFPAARIYTPTAAGNSIKEMVSDTTTEVVLGRVEPEAAAESMKEEADRMLEELA